ncbi:hypothetical protein BKA70DRAFT_512630 [Coprinopsis sp. MPI-PUGE-AT-0042]|nr:hypothetical protein BKA70DRAFT_512630 [Coprinopsis sp. MPI-PUGE-AT-0042]
MVHRGADARLLSNLTAQEKEYSKQWTSLLHASSSSLAGFTAYAAASEPTTSRAILNVAGVLAAADDALAGYRRAIEDWRDLLKGLQQLEEEVGNIVRDREILVTRLIKASNKSASNSKPSTPSLRRFSASTSSVNLQNQNRSIPTSTKLAAAQSELQACETHLASKERELVYRRFQVIRDGLSLRGRAMVETGHTWTQLGNEIGGIVEQELGNGGSGSAQQRETHGKPLPHPAASASSIHVPGSFDSNVSSEGSSGQHPRRRNSIHIPAAHAIGSEIGMPIPFMDTAPSYEDEGPRQSPSFREEKRLSRPPIQQQGPVRGSWVSQQTSDEDWQDANDGFSDDQLPSPVGSGGHPQVVGAPVPVRPTSLLQRLSTNPSDPPHLGDSTRAINAPSVPLSVPSAPGSVFLSDEYRNFRDSSFHPAPQVNGNSTYTSDVSTDSPIRGAAPITTSLSNSSSEGEGQVVTGRHVHVAGVSTGESSDGSPHAEEYRYAVAPPRAIEVTRSTGGTTTAKEIGGLSVIASEASPTSLASNSTLFTGTEMNEETKSEEKRDIVPTNEASDYISAQPSASKSSEGPTVSPALFDSSSPPFTPIPPVVLTPIPPVVQQMETPSQPTSTLPSTTSQTQTTSETADASPNAYGSLSKSQRKKQKKRAKLAQLAKELEDPTGAAQSGEDVEVRKPGTLETENLQEMGVLKVAAQEESAPVQEAHPTYLPPPIHIQNESIPPAETKKLPAEAPEVASYEQETIKQSRKRSDENVVSVFSVPAEGSTRDLPSNGHAHGAATQETELKQIVDKDIPVQAPAHVEQEQKMNQATPIPKASEDEVHDSPTTIDEASLPPPLPLPSTSTATPTLAPIAIPVPVAVPAAAPASTVVAPPSPTTHKAEKRTSVLGRLFGRGRNSGSNKSAEVASSEKQAATAKTDGAHPPASPTVTRALEQEPPTSSPTQHAPPPAIAPAIQAQNSEESGVMVNRDEADEAKTRETPKEPVATSAEETNGQAHNIQGQVLSVPEGFPVPPDLSPMPTVKEVQGMQLVPAPQKEPASSHFSYEASIVAAPSAPPPPLPQQPPPAPAPAQEAPTQAQPTAAAPTPAAEPQLHQVAPESTVQRPYKLSRKEKRERERQDKEREKEEKERQKALEREEREREKASERESKEREKREKLEKKQKERNAPKTHKGLFGGLKGFFGADEDDAHPRASQESGASRGRSEIVETDGTATTWAPPAPTTTRSAPAYTNPMDTASRPKHERRDSKGGLAGLFGKNTRSTNDVTLQSTPPSMPAANGEADDQQPRYIVVENKIDFGAVSSRAAANPPKDTPAKLRSRSGMERRRVASTTSTRPSGTNIPMPTTSTSFDIPRAPAPINVEQIQAQAEQERRAAAHQRSSSSGGPLEDRRAPARASESAGWKTRTDKNLQQSSGDAWGSDDGGRRYATGGGTERMVPTYEPVAMNGSQGLQQRIPPINSASSVSLPHTLAMPTTGLGRSASQASAGPGRRLKKPSHIPVPSANQQDGERQRSPRTMNGVPPVPPLPTQIRPVHARQASAGDGGYISDNSGSVTRRGSGIPTRRTTSMSVPSQGPRNEFGATVLTTGGGGGPGGSIAPGGWGNNLQRNPSVNSGTPRAQAALGQGMGAPAVRRTSITQGTTAPRAPPAKMTDTRNMPYPIPSVPGASTGIASMPIPRAPPPLNADPGLQLGNIIEDMARKNRQAEEQLRVLKGGGVMGQEVSVAPARVQRGTIEGAGVHHGSAPSSSLQKSNTVTSNLSSSSSSRPHYSPLKSAMKNPSRSPSPLTSNIGLPSTQLPRATSPLRQGDGPTTHYQNLGVMAGDEARHVSRIPITSRQPASPPPPNAHGMNDGTPEGSPGPEGPQRRKSVRVSLQPTFSPTPPAIDYEEPSWQSMPQGNSSHRPAPPVRKPARRTKDIWQDSSDEDEAYAKARSALSRAAAEEKNTYSAL